MTNEEIEKIAKELGYEEVKDYDFDSHGKKVFRKGKKYISYDRTGHKGGFWKVQNKQGVREGTYDINLEEKIGD